MIWSAEAQRAARLWRRGTSPSNPCGSSGSGANACAAAARPAAVVWAKAMMRRAFALQSSVAAAKGSSGPNAATAAAEAAAPFSPPPSHLIVFVNGLSGAPSNWTYLCDQLRKRLPPSIARDVLLHRSEVNQRLDTWHGIDRCGQRLADEVRALAAANPNLARISVVAHSMGGLISRYAVGALYNPANGRVAGLQPRHFITLATPHCGCDTEGVAAVPFLEWSGNNVPLLRKALQSIAAPVGALLLQRTGEQFFLLDGSSSSSDGAKGGDDTLPLLVAMTQDVPAKGLYFFSALAAFATRTAYANTDGDHLVGWANSSLRPLSALPPLPPAALTKSARGVVLEDDLARAWSPPGAGTAQLPQQEPGGGGASGWHVLPQSISLSSGDGGDGGGSSSSDDSSAPSADSIVEGAGSSSNSTPSPQQQIFANAQSSAAEADLCRGLEGARSSSGSEKNVAELSRAETVALMLERLSSLPWRRIDVSFSGVFGLAHNNIQVTRRLLNYEGRAVPRHIVDQLCLMEQMLAEQVAAGADTS